MVAPRDRGVKLFVTGAAGFLGSEVARQAEELGWEVLAGKLEREPPHGTSIALDIREEAEVHAAFLRHGPDAVVHTAYRQTEADLWDAVVKGTRNVAEAAHRFGARLVHLSTDLVFDGEREPPARYSEADEPRPVMLYGEAKLAAERLARELHPDALLVRTSVLYGKPEPGPQERLAFSDVPFYVDEIRCPTLVGELAAALLDLVESDLHGPLHVAAPDAVSRYEFARLLRARHGLDADAVEGAPAPRAGRAHNVALDSSRAAAHLGTPLTGVREALHSL
jgi:dTDP-4-dehydrorhamnose reductase